MSTYDEMDTSPDKGKGKIVDEPIANPTGLEDDEEESEEEAFDEHTLPEDEVVPEELDPEDPEGIQTSNIISGGRTRSKAPIDYSQVDQTGLDPEDDEDDDDFEEKPTVQSHDDGDVKME